ncbi:MAG: hypothetical protein K2H53_01160 [Clostridia bacterium]|nr:hypothetical protein [Clostridia bacterium]
MVVQKITKNVHSDFLGQFKCEHCGSILEGHGYHDGYYFKNVLPFCKCPSCGLQSIKGEEKSSYEGFNLILQKDLPEGYTPPESYYSGEPKEEGWKECNRHPDFPCLW